MKFLTGDNFCPPGTLSDIWRQSGLLQVEGDTATPILWVEATDVDAAAAAAQLLQSCPTLCDPIDGSLPGSAIPGILQARTPEWVPISFSNA